MSNETTYWGILCRSCSEPVAFDICRDESFALASANARPGTIRCIHDHTHIYFPRDLRFFPCSAPISAILMEKNREAYLAVNPSDIPVPDELFGTSYVATLAKKNETIFSPNVPFTEPVTKTQPARLGADPRRKIAQEAASIRWANWASSKAS
jgi:hypothetical protein